MPLSEIPKSQGLVILFHNSGHGLGLLRPRAALPAVVDGAWRLDGGDCRLRAVAAELSIRADGMAVEIFELYAVAADSQARHLSARS